MPRGRLVERLESGSDLSLTLLACPAGFGKTSLLAAWHQAEAGRRPIAWLTLDDGDNDPAQLWSYLTAALTRACPALEETLGASIGRRPLDLEMLLPRLVNALDDQPGIALILDDFHLLTMGPARDSLAWLAAHAPDGFQLVLSTRKEPDLPLPALRARCDLLELRADDLRFTATEAETFLNERQSLALAPADVDLLVERTQGWPAGLSLAAMSLRSVDNRHDLVASFGASNRHVINFLHAEVLDLHPPAVQELMVLSSVLDWLSGPLCDAVLDVRNSTELLRELSQTNLFLVPYDGGWYRFHPVFAQVLRSELALRYPGLSATLQRRALVWQRDHATDAGALEPADSEVVRVREPARPEQVGGFGTPGKVQPALGSGRAATAGSGRAEQRPARVEQLTQRERTVLQYLDGDLSEAAIARQLFVTHSTVHSHTRAIYRKLGVSKRAEALRHARHIGLL